MDNATIPAVCTSAMAAHKMAATRQFFARVIRFPYRSSHSRRASKYGFVIGRFSERSLALGWGVMTGSALDISTATSICFKPPCISSVVNSSVSYLEEERWTLSPMPTAKLVEAEEADCLFRHWWFSKRRQN